MCCARTAVLQGDHESGFARRVSCSNSSLSFKKHRVQVPENGPKSFQKRTEIVRNSLKIGPGGSQNRPNWFPEAFLVQGFGPSDSKVRFWMISGRFWGGSWAPKSSQNRQKWRPKRVPFSIRFRISVLIDFRCVSGPKMTSEIGVFGVRNR